MSTKRKDEFADVCDHQGIERTYKCDIVTRCETCELNYDFCKSEYSDICAVCLGTEGVSADE